MESKLNTQYIQQHHSIKFAQKPTILTCQLTLYFTTQYTTFLSLKTVSRTQLYCKNLLEKTYSYKNPKRLTLSTDCTTLNIQMCVSH